jgi:hypothetical protein
MNFLNFLDIDTVLFLPQVAFRRAGPTPLNVPETINIQRTHKKHRYKELFLAATNASILASFRGRVALLRPYTTVINLLNHVPFVQVNKAQDRKIRRYSVRTAYRHSKLAGRVQGLKILVSVVRFRPGPPRFSKNATFGVAFLLVASNILLPGPFPHHDPRRNRSMESLPTAARREITVTHLICR